MVNEVLPPDEKATLCAHLVLLAPPCEFFEVLNDVRNIVGDDPLINKKLAAAVAHYDKDQMIHVSLPNSELPTLLTSFSDLGGGHFMCPRTGVSFHYDHLKQTVSDIKTIDQNSSDLGATGLATWRNAVEAATTDYVNEHFPNGASSVYAPLTASNERLLVMCISSHYCKHQSTGRWRSEWTMKLVGQPPNGEFSVHGVIKVQTHLYEEGNVQLIASKEIDFVLPASHPKEFARECLKKIKDTDCAYQIAIGENFKTMSDTTFKALRRQLPLTRSKMDWNKIITYQIGNELSRASP